MSSTSGAVSGDDARELERDLVDAALYAEPSSCLTKSPPPLGSAQEWLEVSWQGRNHIFETFATVPGANGKLIDLLWRISAKLT
jgi:hypothetical protein